MCLRHEGLMIGIHCHWSFVGDILGYSKIFFVHFCDRRFYGKIDPKLKFFMICGPILKCLKWVGRSKMFSWVNLNMVYGVPI